MAQPSRSSLRNPLLRPPQPPSLPKDAHRIIVKIGTNVLTAGGERLELEVMGGLVSQVAPTFRAVAVSERLASPKIW